MAQVEPGIMAQQDLASIRRITQLLGQQKAWPTEHPVLCDQMQPVGKDLLSCAWWQDTKDLARSLAH